MNDRHRGYSLVLCWVALVGNVGVLITGVSLIATQANQLVTGIFLCVTAAASFYCALLLRKTARSEQANSSRIS